MGRRELGLCALLVWTAVGDARAAAMAVSDSAVASGLPRQMVAGPIEADGSGSLEPCLSLESKVEPGWLAAADLRAFEADWPLRWSAMDSPAPAAQPAWLAMDLAEADACDLAPPANECEADDSVAAPVMAGSDWPAAPGPLTLALLAVQLAAVAQYAQWRQRRLTAASRPRPTGQSACSRPLESGRYTRSCPRGRRPESTASADPA